MQATALSCMHTWIASPHLRSLSSTVAGVGVPLTRSSAQPWSSTDFWTMSQPASPYLPLGESKDTFRLLSLLLQPHPIDGRVQCRLSVEAIDTNVPYEALSYVWGLPDTFNYKIWLNDVLVPIRHNLLLALRALRREYDRILWIDALCIDQSNLEERGHQVRVMGEIYSNANHVLAWLGTPDTQELEHRCLDLVKSPPQRM